MKKRAIITTIYSASAIKYAITKLSPDLVICVVEKGYDKLEGDDAEKKRKALKDLQDAFGEFIKIEILETKSLYKVYDIAKDVISKIDKLADDYDVMLHISEGRKTLSFGLSFAGYVRKDKIEAIYYVVSETNELIKLPVFNLSINKTQKEILSDIFKGIEEVEKLLEKRTDKSRSVIYQYLKELEEEGFLNRDNGNISLTDLGKIAIL